MATGIRASNDWRVKLKSEDEPVPVVPVVAEGRREPLRADHNNRGRRRGDSNLFFGNLETSRVVKLRHARLKNGTGQRGGVPSPARSRLEKPRGGENLSQAPQLDARGAIWLHLFPELIRVAHGEPLIIIAAAATAVLFCN